MPDLIVSPVAEAFEPRREPMASGRAGRFAPAEPGSFASVNVEVNRSIAPLAARRCERPPQGGRERRSLAAATL